MFLGLLIFLIIANQKSSAAFLNVDQTIPDDKKECILKCSIGSHQIDYGCFGKCMYHLPNDFQLKTTIKKDAGDNKRNVVRSETLAPLAEVKSTSRGVELFRGLPGVFGAQLGWSTYLVPKSCYRAALLQSINYALTDRILYLENSIQILSYTFKTNWSMCPRKD